MAKRSQSVLPKIFSDTGGAFYHLRALRFRASLWRPFLSVVNGWLESWNPKAQTLFVFGPSGGWTLPYRFLLRFERVICIEPDPIARLIFANRFARIKGLELIARADCLPWTSVQGFREVLARDPDAAVLFSNLLGQLSFIAPDNFESVHLQRQFFDALRDREWASYHDILSADVRLREPSLILRGPLKVEQLAERFFVSDHPLTVRDHGTSWLKAHEYAGWQLGSHAAHIVGFTRQGGHASDPLNTESP